jgi:hypothetical protein
MKRNRVVLGVVAAEIQAENIVRRLAHVGISSQDISVVFPHRHGTREFAHEHHTRTPEGAAVGVASGGLLGGTLGALVGVGALVIPGLGGIIAAGPLLATLSATAAGATLGGIAGALIGMGIPELEAKQYEGKLVHGNILLAAHVESPEEEARVKEVLRREGALDIRASTESAVPRAAE